MGMHAEDAIGGIVEHGWWSRRTSPKTCRHCGARGLGWRSTKVGWRLADESGVHNCTEYKTKKKAAA